MSLSGIYELLLRGLAGEADPNTLNYISREAAYTELKKRTGKDFGFDPEEWRAYIQSKQSFLGVGKLKKGGG